MKSSYLVLVMALFLSSCMGTRYLSDGEKIVNKTPKVSAPTKELSNELEKLVLQKGNKRLLGFVPIAHLAHAYEHGLEQYDSARYFDKIRKINTKYDTKIAAEDRDKKISKYTKKKAKKTDKYYKKLNEGNWWMRIGEPLAVYDSSLHESSSLRIAQYLATKGHFKSRSGFIVDEKPKKVNVSYWIDLKPAYFLDSIVHSISDTAVNRLYEAEAEQSFLVSGNQYDQANFEKERERINSMMLDNGYFQFSRQYVHYQIDTTSLGDKKVLVKLVVSSPNEGLSNHRTFTIDSVVFTTPGIENEPLTKSHYEGITYQFGSERYKTDILNRKIAIRKGDLYSRANATETQRRLSFLDAYKFVNINFDSTKTEGLVANIFTKPLTKYQTSNEIGFIQEDFSQILPGPFVNLGLKKRNAFHGFETVQFNINFALLGISNIEARDAPYSLFEYGGRLLFTFPQFLFPTSEGFKQRISPYNPRTNLSLSYNYENRTREYERSQAITSFSYLWRVRNEKQFTFSPINFNYTDIRYIHPDFQEFLDEQDSLGNGSLVAAFKPSITSNMSADAVFNRNNYGNLKSNSSLAQYFGEVGGTFANVFDEGILRDTTFAIFQWIKATAGWRKHYVLTKGQLALRLNIGGAYTYGEDRALPYEKRFYAGGSNSVRAWPVRRLGPGAYGDTLRTITDQTEIVEIDYQREQGGDMIIEGNIEYRRKVIDVLDYAVFLDFGNIWILNSDQNIKDHEGDDGKFRINEFYREFAVGGGIGFRLDFSFLVFRLDVGVQMIDPAQPLGERFILNRLSFQDMDVFRNKSNLNIGIGLPF